MRRYLLLLLMISVLGSPIRTQEQELRAGDQAYVVSDAPVIALLDDGTKIEVSFGQIVTIEEIVPNYVATRFQGQYALLDPEAVLAREDAKKYLDELVQRQPTSRNFVVKARVETGLRNLDDAIIAAERAIELDAKNVAAWTARSSAYSMQKDFDAAERDIDEALKIDSGFDQANNMKFYILQTTNRREEALGYIEKAVEINPHKAVHHANYASLLLQLGRTEEAVASIKKAMEVAPAYYFGHYFMGYHLNRAGQPEEAAGYLKKSAELNPCHYWTQYYLAKYAQDKGDMQTYVRHLGLSADARDAPNSARNSYAWVLATSIQADLRDGQKAVQLAQQLVENSGDSESQVYQYHKTLAAAYAEAGEFDKAIETLDEIDSSRFRDNVVTEMYELFEDEEPFHKER